ncbi:MAG: TonB-dependent receptor plug domain-containing protein, partial [Bacteroidetes bacterium]|nr:TonB-dependent receptor plug domain-containing protein [Bacteroidota bacterium]
MYASFPRYVIAVLAVASLFAGVGGALYAQSSVIEGTARDAETGEPISYLNVVARGESDWFGASANDAGQFRIAGLPAGAYLVQATAIGYESAEQRVQVEAGVTRSVTFELTPQAYDLNEVVVLAEEGQSASATTIHRVPAAAIERQDAADVSELAKLIPATHVATNSRGQTILYFRNAGDRQVGQFFDGALVNVPWDNRVDISLFPAGVIESVTAAKGVVPVQYGTNVIGGAINFQSRTLSSSEIEGDAGRITEVSGQLGTAAHRQASVVHLGRAGRWDYTAAVQYTERGDQPLPADT